MSRASSSSALVSRASGASEDVASTTSEETAGGRGPSAEHGSLATDDADAHNTTADEEQDQEPSGDERSTANSGAGTSAGGSSTPLGPLDSHITEVLQGITLTAQSARRHKQARSHAHISAAPATDASPSSVSVNVAATPSSGGAQTHSPRRRKPRAQEVEVDDESDSRGDRAATTADNGAHRVTHGADEDRANAAAQPALPPGVILRIPLPSAARSTPGAALSSLPSSSTPSLLAGVGAAHKSGLHINKKQKQDRTRTNLASPTPGSNGSGATTNGTAPTAAVTSDGGVTTPQRTSTKALLDTPETSPGLTSVTSTPANNTTSASAAALSPGMIRCDLCDKLLSSPAQLADHLQGRKHINMMQLLASGGVMRCELCDKTFNSTLDQAKHMDSAGHRANAMQHATQQQQQQQGSAHFVQRSRSSPTPTLMHSHSAGASVASGASSPFTVGHPYMLPQASASTSATSSPSHTHARPRLGHFHASPAPPLPAAALHFCPLCRLRFPDAGALAHHFVGRRHAAAIFDAQQQSMRFSAQPPPPPMQFQQQFHHPPMPMQMMPMSMPPQPFQAMPGSHQWQQMQMHMQQQAQSQANASYPFVHPSFFLPPSSYPPSYPPPHPYGVPTGSIFEEDGSEAGRMDADSIAAGIVAERDEIVAVTLPSSPVHAPANGDEEARDKADNDAEKDTDAPVGNRPSEAQDDAHHEPQDLVISSEEVESTPASATVAAAAAAAAAAPDQEDSEQPIEPVPDATAGPTDASTPAPDDGVLGSSRKRKFGRYSPVVLSSQRPATFGLARPRLAHSPPPSAAHQPAAATLVCSCATHPAHAYPMAPPSVDAMSVASSVVEENSPRATAEQQQQQQPQQYPQPAPFADGSAPVPCLVHGMDEQWSQPSQPSSSHLEPHPECRAPHYIFVPYIVQVPANIPLPPPPPPSLHFEPTFMPQATYGGVWPQSCAPVGIDSPANYPMAPAHSSPHRHAHAPSQVYASSMAHSMYHIPLQPHQQPQNRRRSSGAAPPRRSLPNIPNATQA